MKTKAELVAENRKLKGILRVLVSTYRREEHIACITPGARRDAKRDSVASRYFKMWDDAKAAL